MDGGTPRNRHLRTAFWCQIQSVRLRCYSLSPFSCSLSASFGTANFFRLIRTPSCFVLRSCTILVRMAKDYGDNVIFWDERPFGEIPVHWSHSPAETCVSWSPVLSAIDLMLQDVQSRKNPIWDHVLDIRILFVPSSSAISRQWSVGVRSSRGNVSEE